MATPKQEYENRVHRVYRALNGRDRRALAAPGADASTLHDRIGDEERHGLDAIVDHRWGLLRRSLTPTSTSRRPSRIRVASASSRGRPPAPGECTVGRSGESHQPATVSKSRKRTSPDSKTRSTERSRSGYRDSSAPSKRPPNETTRPATARRAIVTATPTR